MDRSTNVMLQTSTDSCTKRSPVPAPPISQLQLLSLLTKPGTKTMQIPLPLSSGLSSQSIPSQMSLNEQLDDHQYKVHAQSQSKPLTFVIPDALPKKTQLPVSLPILPSVNVTNVITTTPDLPKLSSWIQRLSPIPSIHRLTNRSERMEIYFSVVFRWTCEMEEITHHMNSSAHKKFLVLDFLQTEARKECGVSLEDTLAHVVEKIMPTIESSSLLITRGKTKTDRGVSLSNRNAARRSGPVRRRKSSTNPTSDNNNTVIL